MATQKETVEFILGNSGSEGIPSLPLRCAGNKPYFFDRLFSRNSAASALISVKSRCISLHPYQSA